VTHVGEEEAHNEEEQFVYWEIAFERFESPLYLA